MALNDCTTYELEAELLKANHELRHASNTAATFTFRASLATTADAKADAEGCALYWARMADAAGCHVRNLQHALCARAALNADPDARAQVERETMAAFRYSPCCDLWTRMTHNSTASR